MLHSDDPNSEDLPELLSSDRPCSQARTSNTSFSDDLEAWNDAAAEDRCSKQKSVVQHRSWKTTDIFRSEPGDQPWSPPLRMADLASSPPQTPSAQNKRKFEMLDLGNNQLSRLPKAKRTYYGININQLLEDAEAEDQLPKAPVTLPTPPAEQYRSKKDSLLWTEKYRARKFTDLIGDERTHRSVMYWLKRWDQIVYPGVHRPKVKSKGPDGHSQEERAHRKILMLTGPPGLGKTTLAHVCARQAGYEIQEINASDERSSTVVKGRIRDMVGTENVKGVDTQTVGGRVRKAGKPVCVIVDEVDGVVGGSGGSGEGGFIKALIDLVMLDQKNSAVLGTMQQAPTRKKKGDRFRMLRPIILVCNDVYHPALRPLRQSSLAEIVHVRKPQISTVINRMQAIFEKEGVPCEGDGVRRLCEATWGVSNRKEDRHGSGAGDGDVRGIMVVGEWVAGKLRAANERTGDARLTRRWVEENLIHDLNHGGGAARGLGRGGPKDIVDRIFQEGAGFPKTSATVTPQQKAGNAGVQGVAEGLKRTATDRLRQLVDTHGDTDRIMTDCFSSYPDHPFQDDTFLSKPDAAYEWLNFHDRLSGAVYSSNEWELAPYLSTPILAFHHLFASPTRAQYAKTATVDPELSEPTHPFSGSQASWAAHEATKHNTAILQNLHSSLDMNVSRLFTSPSSIAVELLPNLLRMLSPSINPTLVTGSGSDKSIASVRKASEQVLLHRCVNAMHASGVRFERIKVTSGDDNNSGSNSYNGPAQWIFRMEPPLDTLATFETGGKAFGETGQVKTRFAVRQVLDQEFRKEEKRRAEVARMARFQGEDTNPPTTGVAVASSASAGSKARTADLATAKPFSQPKDFFGRALTVPATGSIEEASAARKKRKDDQAAQEIEDRRVWVTFHEGFSNAVRKPVTLKELIEGL
nr:chromosome transmission fidelity protein 18 [Quercus suber]